jgi:hypothetical protein
VIEKSLSRGEKFNNYPLGNGGKRTITIPLGTGEDEPPKAGVGDSGTR